MKSTDMPTTPSGKKPAKKTSAKADVPRAAFHHGNLREALIEAAIALVEEGGPENAPAYRPAHRSGIFPTAWR